MMMMMCVCVCVCVCVCCISVFAAFQSAEVEEVMINYLFYRRSQGGARPGREKWLNL